LKGQFKSTTEDKVHPFEVKRNSRPSTLNYSSPQKPSITVRVTPSLHLKPLKDLINPIQIFRTKLNRSSGHILQSLIGRTLTR
jgi:hypothetical protein